MKHIEAFGCLRLTSMRVSSQLIYLLFWNAPRTEETVGRLQATLEDEADKFGSEHPDMMRELFAWDENRLLDRVTVQQTIRGIEDLIRRGMLIGDE